jgi:uncharacterized protein (DUF488 family)
MTLYTIGHSTLPIKSFMELLHRYGITAVCDVRSSPYSRVSPQYCKDGLRAALAEVDIEYVFLGKELGARPSDRDCFEDGKATYERIAATAAFQTGLARIRKGVKQYSIALMCAEKDPITCHRTILVARHLVDLGVTHILSNGSVESHDEAMLRLVRSLGVRADAASMHRSILESAYQLQGDRICFKDDKVGAPKSRSSQEAPRFI